MKKNCELKKHIGTIQSSNPLSLVQRKISNALLYNAYSQLLEQEEHEIEIKNLCRLIGYDSNDYQLIKGGLRKLLSTVIEWNLLNTGDKSEEVWSASSMLASVSIEGSKCVYSYSSRLKKLLYMPSMYARVNMEIQSKFKSAYALALYENCIRYQNLPYSCWFTIEIFRKLMGVDENKYKIFRDFKRRIIDKAVDEVNLYSNLLIIPEMRKKQRKVTSIRFKIDKKKQCLQDNPLITRETVFVILTRDWGFSVVNASKVLEEFDKDYIMNKINSVTQSTSFKNGKIKSKSSYLLKVLQLVNTKEGYNHPKYKDYNSETDSNSCFLNTEEQYNNYIIKFQNDVVHKDIIQSFEAYLKKEHTKVLWKYYQRDMFEHKAIKSEFIQYLKKNFSYISNKL
ncbi:MAG: replication initiation protein [Legionellales bacterium]|nr:replication initiation protein [Legionellales bacterium]